jgi:hypothetical protein
VLALLLLAAPRRASAQLPIEGWVRPLVAIPVGSFAGRDDGIAARASSGLDAGGSISLGSLRVYGEYQQVDFGCDECGEAGLEETVLDRGWGAGAILPLGMGLPLAEPWVRLGVIGSHLRFRGQGETAYSDASLGWSAGAGADLRLRSWLLVQPVLLYRSYGTTFRFGIDVPDRDLTVSYFGLGLALALRF